MFQGFMQKNKEEVALDVGNVAMFILLAASFVWFLMFSVSVINDALNMKVNAGGEGNQQLRMNEFKKVKEEFFGKNFGFIVPPSEAAEEIKEEEIEEKTPAAVPAVVPVVPIPRS